VPEDGEAKKEREGEGAKTSKEELEEIRANMVWRGGGEEEKKKKKRPDIRLIL